MDPRVPDAPARKAPNQKSRKSAREARAGASATEVAAAASTGGRRSQEADDAAPGDEGPSGSQSTRPPTDKGRPGPAKPKRYCDRGPVSLLLEFRPGWLTSPTYRCAREGCRYSVNSSCLYGSWCCDWCYAVDVHGLSWPKKHSPTCDHLRDRWSENQDLKNGPLYAPKINNEWCKLPEEYARRKQQRHD